VPLAGRDLRRLGGLSLRRAWAAFGAIALQVAITSFPMGARGVHVALHLASYGLAALFVVANRRVPGLAVVAAGGALNALAIALNGGVMPASRAAMAAAGVAVTPGFMNSGPVAHPHLLALGDIIGVPAPFGLGNVLSAGDLLILAGTLVLLHRVCARAGAPTLDGWAPTDTAG
jgi:hypothetical protein